MPKINAYRIVIGCLCFFCVLGNAQENLWSALRNNFRLNTYAAHPRVQSQIAWYLRNPSALTQALDKATPYLYYIQQETKNKRLPTEWALLPFIESGFNPFSHSRKGASGLWQLMPATGAQHGLKKNWWYDGRRDVHASTQAALKHLRFLNQQFSGDWLLIAAAYDAGHGRVKQAMLNNQALGRPTDFWHLHLPTETQIYVPRLLALITLIREADRYQLKLPTIPSQPYFSKVRIEKSINLLTIAKLAKISLKELYQLNPGHNHYMTDPSGPHQIVLPNHTIELFKYNYSQQLFS